MNSIDLYTLIIAGGSLCVAAITLIAAFLQTSMTNRSSSELQTLISFREMSKEYDHTVGMNIISGLSCTSYDDFLSEVPKDDQIAVRNCVEFLNFVAIMTRAGHIRKQSVWDVYFVSFRKKGEKLSPWWFVGERLNYPQKFKSAQAMASDVLNITEEEISNFDRAITG